MRYLPDDNLRYPAQVRIGNSLGSGFYFRTDEKLFLATALHVIVDPKTMKTHGNILELTSYDKDLAVDDPIVYEVDLTKAPIRRSSDQDAALVEIGDVEDEGRKMKTSLGVRKRSSTQATLVVVPTESLRKFDDVLVSNEVFVLGYPSSLSLPDDPQIELERPLLRRGIVAGKNYQKGTIILDSPVYFGNSGGLVIEVEQMSINEKRFRIIGIVSQYVPFIEKMKSLQFGYTNLRFENSGYSVAVPVDAILDLVTEKPEKVDVPSG